MVLFGMILQYNFLNIDDTNWFRRLRFELRVELLNIRAAGFLEINYLLTKCNRVHRLCTMPIRPVTVYNISCYSDKHFLSSYQTKSASLLNGDADKP